MRFWWWALWFLIVAQLIAIPFWHKLVGKVIRKKFSRKLMNFCAGILNFSVRVVSYLAVLIALVIGLLSLSLRIGKREMLAKMPPPKIISSQLTADEDGWIDTRGQIHMHCYLSHDSKGTLEEISLAASKNGVRWIILTDHHKRLPTGIYPDYVNGVLFIYGSERNAPKGGSQFWASLKDSEPTLHLHGHLEEFCLLDELEKWKILNGDRWELWNYTDKKWMALDGMELVNFHANAIDKKLSILGSGFFVPNNIYNGIIEPLPRLFDHWQEVAEKTGRPIPIFAAPDAHQNLKILGVQMDPYELILGLVSTHIWIDKNQELNQESIFEAVKKGRTYIAFDYLGDTTGFQFIATKKDEKVFTGETMEKAEYLEIRPPDCLLTDNPYIKGRRQWNTSELTFKFYRNNQLNGMIDCYESFATNMKPHSWEPAPGFWRVEVWRKGKPWIISGQILIK